MSSVKETLYKKRAGTSGMSGQLYKTKLISLVLFKLVHDERFEYFYLASNMDEIGSYDDLCFKAKIKGIDRPVIVFIQAKHKDDRKTFVDFDEALSFHDSYSKVIQKFTSDSKVESEDKIFNGKIDENECIFILYTNAKHSHESDKQFHSEYASTLNELLATGKGGTHLLCTDNIVKSVTEITLKQEIASLAEHFTRFLKPDTNHSMQILHDNYMQKYHVLLATSVLNISSIQNDEQNSQWRILTFRKDFFETNDTSLLLLKNAICKQILQHQINEHNNKEQVEEPNVEENLSIFFDNPCASTLCNLIGTHIEYKNETLQFMSQRTKDELQRLEQINLSQVIIDEAMSIAARNILLTLELKVPATFGNTDLMLSERSMASFINNVVIICKNFKLANGHKIVTLDETTEGGLLYVEGGLAGAVGNLLVYDEVTKLLKFTNDCTFQQNNIGIILDKLKSRITDLHLYRFYVKATVPMPNFLFYCQNMAKEILHKFIIYPEQSDQNDLEEVLISQINDYYNNNNLENLQVRPEAIFLNYHGAVQAWFLLKNNAPYLTKQSKIYSDAMNSIIQEPLMNSLNDAFTMTKMKNIEYTTHAFETLQRLTILNHETNKVTLAENTIISTEVTTLTAIKVMKYLNHKGINNYTLLDLGFTINLTTEDFCALKVELKKTNKYIIILCEKLQGGVVGYEKYLTEIIQVAKEKQKVVITEPLFVNMAQKAFPSSEKENTNRAINHDDIIYEQQSLVDYTQDSRKSIINNKKVIFQGELIDLDLVLDNTSSTFIDGPVLNNIVYNETIELGAPVNNPNYMEIKYFCQDRSVDYFNCHLVSGNIRVTAIDYIFGNVTISEDIHSLLIIDLLEDPNNYTHHIDLSDSNESPIDIDFIFLCSVNIKHIEKDFENVDYEIKKDDLIYHMSLKKNYIKNKVWIVKITLFDCRKLYEKWHKDRKTDKNTLNTLRKMCKGIVYDSMIRYDSLKLSHTPGALNTQIVNSALMKSKCPWNTISSSNNDGTSVNIRKSLLFSSLKDKIVRVEYSHTHEWEPYESAFPSTSWQGIGNVGSSKDKQATLNRNEYFNSKEEGTSSRTSDVSLKDLIYEVSKETAQEFYSVVPNIVISFCNDVPDNVEEHDDIRRLNTTIALPWYQTETKFENSNVYDFSINYKYKFRMNVNTFNDIKEDVVLLSARAGVGKSTFLAHLSQKQTKFENNIWIVRINLVRYSKIFSTWQEDTSILIDTLGALQFICQVVINNKNITVDLKESTNKIYLEKCSGDAWDRFNLNMFLHYYNEGKLLMLFDGFDEICPDYKNEVIKLLQVVKNFPQRNKMWITSRPYNSILPDLERHFGNSFILANFNKTERSQFLTKFWNILLIRNSIVECENGLNLRGRLFEFISVIFPTLDDKLKVVCYDFYKFMLSKVPFLNSHHFETYREIIEEVYRSLDTYVSSLKMSEIEKFLSTPLLLYQSAVYFVNAILNLDNALKTRIDLEMHIRFSGILMYQFFIEIILRKILFKDKSGLDVDIPYINEKCEAEVLQCVAIHKKLGAHAVFGNPIFERFDLHLKEFKEMTPFNLEAEAGVTEINSLIDRIMVGKERAGLISHVTSEYVPVFIHKTFAEYFAYEYVYDLIKSERFDDRTKKLLAVVILIIANQDDVKDEYGDPVVSPFILSTWVPLKEMLDEKLSSLITDTMREWDELWEYVVKSNTNKIFSLSKED